MPTATFRFYEELNDWLPEKKRKTDFESKFRKNATLREIIELFGVSCEHIDLILVNGRSVSFEHVINGGDRISVYPVFERFNIDGVTRLRGNAIRRLKFIFDSNLKELSNKMEKLGFDVCFVPNIGDDAIIEKSNIEGRIIISRRHGFLKSKSIYRIILLKTEFIETQVREILESLFID